MTHIVFTLELDVHSKALLRAAARVGFEDMPNEELEVECDLWGLE